MSEEFRKLDSESTALALKLLKELGPLDSRTAILSAVKLLTSVLVGHNIVAQDNWREVTTEMIGVYFDRIDEVKVVFGLNPDKEGLN